MDRIDPDRLVDYRAEYTAVVQKYTISGDTLRGLCPFHKESNDSFSVNLQTGQWHCFAEDISGNFVSFWARLNQCDTGEAYKQILAKYGVASEPGQGQPKSSDGKGRPYTLEQYSADKGLPLDFLQKECHLYTRKERNGSCLILPYLGEDGQEVVTRKRYANKDFRWSRGSAGNIILYGLWRLPEMRKAGWIVLVEGESDTQTLWHLGLPAIGVAGATLFKPWQMMDLQGLKIYLHQEPDDGGKKFRARVTDALRETGFRGELYVWSCRSLGSKDPSDAYLTHGKDKATQLLRKAMSLGEQIDLNAPTGDNLPDAPIALKQPPQWTCDEKGVTWINPKSGTPELVCRTPLLLTQRLRSLETGDEKIEVAYRRDGAWKTAIFPRSTIFSARSITALADLGCTITSENARNVVRYLGALEAENVEYIPRSDSASTFGWQPGRRFIPGHDEGIVLDIDPSQRVMAAAYSKAGTLEQWVEVMRPHRERDIFRFILAAGFAAPLLRIVKQRIFFLYNWGGSKGGKTAALKAALSAWGDPERLMVNFNATQVGLERTAAFYCDLPLGIDERQLAGTNQTSLEKIVYMIASGKGKTRGSKTGGIQAIQQWRTVALATGEEPLSTETSQTGVSTRVLELYGPPFDSEPDAAMMHQQTQENCGWAGPEFVGRILAMDEAEIVRRYEDFQTYVQGISSGKNGAHTSGIAVVALADALIGEWFFGETQEGATARAMEMAATILLTQVEPNTSDVNEAAVQFVTDFVLSHRAYFGDRVNGECYGFRDESTGNVYIYPSVLNQALRQEGFSPKKTLRYMAERGLIGVNQRGREAPRYSVVKWIQGKTVRFVEFIASKVTETDAWGEPEPDPDPAKGDKEGENVPKEMDFHQLSDTEPVPEEWEQLPF